MRRDLNAGPGHPHAGENIDRFLHHAEIISMQGKSYRMHNRPADGGAEAVPKPASVPTGKAPRLRGGNDAAGRKTGTDGTN